MKMNVRPQGDFENCRVGFLYESLTVMTGRLPTSLAGTRSKHASTRIEGLESLLRVINRETICCGRIGLEVFPWCYEFAGVV